MWTDKDNEAMMQAREDFWDGRFGSQNAPGEEMVRNEYPYKDSIWSVVYIETYRNLIIENCGPEVL